MGMLEGHEKLRQAAQKVLTAIVSNFVSSGVRIVADWAANQATQATLAFTTETQKTAAVTSGVAARTAAEQAGATASAGASLGVMAAQIQRSASEAFAGVAGFLAPVLGPAALGPAAGVEASVLAAASFAQGSWQLPSDMVANVHKGEMIVPAAATPWAQSALASAAAGGAQRGGDTHIHNWNFNGGVLDGRSMAKMVAQMFDSNPSLRPKY